MNETDRIKDDISKSSLSSQVYTHIKRMIISQEIKSGQRIPEEAIAGVFGVSRTPVREALRELEKNGLVIIHPRKYAEVVSLSPDDKRQIGELRIQLDSLAVRLLCGKISDAHYRELAELAERTVAYAEAGQIGDCFEADSVFHCKLAEYSGNKYLLEYAEKLDLKVQLLRNIEAISNDIVLEGVRLHIPIVNAIRAGDPVLAEKLVAEHLSKYYFTN